MADKKTVDLPEITDPELQMLINNKQDGWGYRERRHDQWDENYELYRDHVTINRLTQRQSVNLPLMKMVIKTILKDMDDMPVLYFENLDNNKDAEIFKNEYWKYTVENNNMVVQDIVDKRQEALYGRTYDQWQIVDGKVKMSVIDPMDILISRYADPTNIHSSRFLIHTHIFVPLATLEMNEDYDQERVKDLKNYYASTKGLIKAKDNLAMLQEKNKKMADLGVSDIDSPVLGETYVELSLHFIYREDEAKESEQIYLYVEADDRCILMKKPLEEVIGVTKDHFWQNHFPYNSWAGDVERQDWYSVGMADMVRTPNKIINSWFSQLVENRTLRNYGMHYYNTNIEGFVPQSYQPVPWGWYGVPVPDGKNISDVFTKVDVPDLSESLDEMQFIIGMMEKATGATATQQGAQTERKVTLGEVQLALGEAKERIKGMSKFYTRAWKERGLMFIKLLEAAPEKIEAVKVYRKGKNTSDIYSREIAPKDWKSDSGYQCKVWSLDEKNTRNTEELQKLDAVKANMPDNPKLTEVYQRKLLEFAGLSPDEINEIMQFEEQKTKALMSGSMGGMAPEMGQMGAPAPMQAPTPQIAAPQAPQASMPAIDTGMVDLMKNKKKAKAVQKLKSIKSKIK